MVLNTWYSTIYNSSTNDSIFKIDFVPTKNVVQKWLRVKYDHGTFSQVKDLLRVVKGIEQEAYDITSVLPSKTMPY